MFNSGDANGVSAVVKGHAVVANAQPKLRRFDVLKTFHVAFAGFQIAGQRAQDTQSGGLIDSAELRLGLLVPDNVLAHAQRLA